MDHATEVVGVTMLPHSLPELLRDIVQHRLRLSGRQRTRVPVVGDLINIIMYAETRQHSHAHSASRKFACPSYTSASRRSAFVSCQNVRSIHSSGRYGPPPATSPSWLASHVAMYASARGTSLLGTW